MNNQRRLLYLTGLILFFCLSAAAQETTLTGAIVIGKAEFMSYKITYKLTSQHVLSGYSVCDVNGNDETKARITGFYNPKTRTLTFEEKSILSTRSKIPATEFCLMKVKGKFEKKAGKSVFTGKFESTCRNPQITCDSGTLVLLTEKNLDDLAKKTAKALEKRPLADSLKKETGEKPAPEAWVRNVIELLPGTVTTFDLKSDRIQFDLVDDRIQDGDKITLLKNGVKVVSGLEITNHVQSFTFNIPAGEKDVSFTIRADDEGLVALTTIKAALRNGNEVNLIVVSLNKGQSVTIVLKRK